MEATPMHSRNNLLALTAAVTTALAGLCVHPALAQAPAAEET
jgi:hypothetical protein